MFETRTISPFTDRQRNHQWLEAGMKTPGIDSPRDYLWSVDGDDARHIYLRCAEPRGEFDWKPVRVPETGEVIEFSLCAVARRGCRNHKYPIVEHDDLEQWLVRVTAPLLTILDGTIDRAPVWIAHPDQGLFPLHGAEFNGSAVVIDAAALKAKMLAGIGTGKTYGFGLLFAF